MLEYYYNGLGQTDANHYSARDLVYLLAGETAGFAGHYLFGGLRYTLRDRFTFSTFALGNLVDRSVMLLPAAGYDVSENITVETAAQIGIGDRRRSEYGGLYPNLILTVHGYF